MKIDRADLLEALNKVRPGLAGKEIIEQSTSFVFMDGVVITYNDQIAVSYPVDENLYGAVQSKELYALLNKSKAKEIDIDITDTELILKTANSKAGIQLESEINLPIEAVGLPEEFEDLPQEFGEAVGFCIFSAASDMVSPTLANVHVFNGYAESCDNFRVTRWDMGEDAEEVMGDEELLIPADAAKYLSNYDINKYGRSDGWLHFREDASGLIFSCRTYNDDYPDLDNYLEVKGSNLTLPKGLKDILDRAAIFTEETETVDLHVKVQIEKNNMTVSSQNGRGWFKEDIEIKYKGKALEFNVNPIFLSQIYDKVKEVTVGETTLMFSGEDFDHAVSLVLK